ncbi:MAG: tRNA (guanosine(37)-N1)-methyltransferase TrmD [Lentisphaerae bacterium]|nr:tRNA (guanosine(37)-N1)-methyltransferase TrmD [Lentisphaerota bacterium]
MQVDIITIFPSMVRGFLEESIMKRAAERGAVTFRVINLRDFTGDRHQSVDDRPYGGGPGMVMKPEPFFKAVEAARGVARDAPRVILMSPQGRPFSQALAAELARAQHLIFLCGHYEGVDERVAQAAATDEISIGDYVLTNGTLAAAVVIDAVVRLLPDVLGAKDATAEESFQDNRLEYPQYTRPENFRGLRVPDILLTGDHAAIAHWRSEQSRQRTRARRPDLLIQPEADPWPGSGRLPSSEKS